MPWFFVGSNPPLCHPVADNWVAKSVAIRGAMAEGNLRIKKGKGGRGKGFEVGYPEIEEPRCNFAGALRDGP